MLSQTIATTRKTEVINVTEILTAWVGDVQTGLAVFTTPHTTAALLICEDDSELREDIVRAVENLFAPLRPFKHIRNNNPNTEAHLFSALAGTSLCVPVIAGKLMLGTYQQLLFLEMDGPKQRELRCLVLPG